MDVWRGKRGLCLLVVLIGSVMSAFAQGPECAWQGATPSDWSMRGPLCAQEAPGPSLGMDSARRAGEHFWPESGEILVPDIDGWRIIANIADFLEVCPTEDPAYSQIREDFTIRRNDVVVGELTCTSPVSSMPIDEWTDELVTLHGLRTIYYMDRYMSGHLPWTDGSLYDWMRSKIGGINIKGTVSYCCEIYDDEPYIVIREFDDANRDYDRYWPHLSGNIDLYAHEVRHVDGYYHTSCCGITNGCDDDFYENDLTAYGIQWWLHYLWLTGGINVGTGCLEQSQIVQIAGWHLSSLSGTRDRFCYTLPPEVSMPAEPGGPCDGPIFLDGFESGDTSAWPATVPSFGTYWFLRK